MFRRISQPNIIFFIIAILLTACGGKTYGPVEVVTDYLNAWADKNADTLSLLSCAEWEEMALLELDSFQAVETRLETLSCLEAGTDEGVTLVTCQGKLIATYDGEDQEIDLSERTYEVVSQDGNYLVCGYK